MGERVVEEGYKKGIFGVGYSYPVTTAGTGRTDDGVVYELLSTEG